MPNKLFLETYPLLKRFNFTVSYYNQKLENLPMPAINMNCKICRSRQTFNMMNEYWENEGTMKAEIWDKTTRLKYRCSACNNFEHIFFVEFIKKDENKDDENSYDGYMRKVGQNPPWEIKINKSLANLLGVYSELYKKGLTCESEGYGIGAYAYYRRIVEGIIDKLLDSIAELIESDENKEIYTVALASTKNAKDASHKIELVKDLLPVSLTPNGLNPLSIIYTSISEGIHTKTDGDCLELADSIRKSLIFLVEQIFNQKKTRSEFTESMKKLLTKKEKV